MSSFSPYILSLGLMLPPAGQPLELKTTPSGASGVEHTTQHVRNCVSDINNGVYHGEDMTSKKHPHIISARARGCPMSPPKRVKA